MVYDRAILQASEHNKDHRQYIVPKDEFVRELRGAVVEDSMCEIFSDKNKLLTEVTEKLDHLQNYFSEELSTKLHSTLKSVFGNLDNHYKTLLGTLETNYLNSIKPIQTVAFLKNLFNAGDSNIGQLTDSLVNFVGFKQDEETLLVQGTLDKLRPFTLLVLAKEEELIEELNLEIVTLSRSVKNRIYRSLGMDTENETSKSSIIGGRDAANAPEVNMGIMKTIESVEKSCKSSLTSILEGAETRNKQAFDSIAQEYKTMLDLMMKQTEDSVTNMLTIHSSVIYILAQINQNPDVPKLTKQRLMSYLDRSGWKYCNVGSIIDLWADKTAIERTDIFCVLSSCFGQGILRTARRRQISLNEAMVLEKSLYETEFERCFGPAIFIALFNKSILYKSRDFADVVHLYQENYIPRTFNTIIEKSKKFTRVTAAQLRAFLFLSLKLDKLFVDRERIGNLVSNYR